MVSNSLQPNCKIIPIIIIIQIQIQILVLFILILRQTLFRCNGILGILGNKGGLDWVKTRYLVIIIHFKTPQEVSRPGRKSILRYLGRDGRVFRRYLGQDGTVQKRTFLTYLKNYFNNVLLAHNNRDRGHARFIGTKTD